MKTDEDKVFIQDISLKLLSTGVPIRVNLGGRSMLPFLKAGDMATVVPVDASVLEVGDIVMFQVPAKMIAHRIIRIQKNEAAYTIITKGDSSKHPDAPLTAGDILGKLIAFEHKGQIHDLDSPVWKKRGRFMARNSHKFRLLYYLYFLFLRIKRKLIG